MYVGTSGMKAQMKYADKRGSPLVVIQGGDEKAKGEVTLKDLALGSQLASGVESREEYASQRLAQVSVPEADLVAVKKMLDRMMLSSPLSPRGRSRSADEGCRGGLVAPAHPTFPQGGGNNGR